VKSAGSFRWFIAALLFLASALSFFDRQVLSVLAPQILRDLGMTNVGYSHAVSAFTLAYALTFAVAGRFVDLVGTRTGLGVMVAFWTVASLLHAIVRSSEQLTISRFLLGVGESACFPGAAKGVMERFLSRERAFAMGVATTGGSAFGAVIAPPVIVWIATLVGWRTTFLITGIAGGVWVALWFIFYRPPEQSPATITAQERPWTLRRLVTRRDVWGLIVTRFLVDPVFYFYMFWIPQYLHQERGASLQEIGRLTWIPFFTLAISSLIGGAVSDALVRRGWPIGAARKTIMAAAAALTPVSILALYATDSFWAVVLLGVLMFAHGFWMTNYMTLIGDLFSSGSVGTVVGLTGTAGGLGGFLSGVLLGRFVDTYSFAPAFVLAGLLYPVGLLVILTTVRASKIE
jgi:MFS transporter, ACS family, hexuronate transporter